MSTPAIRLLPRISKIWRQIQKRTQSITDLRRRLKPYPGHFRQLMLSVLRNLMYLSFLRLRCRLTGRRLIVIGLPERLGDIVACTPLARRQRQENPRDLIVWACRSTYLDVLRGNPDLDVLLPLYCFTEWIWMRKLKFLYDRAYNLPIPPNGCKKCYYADEANDSPWKVNTWNHFDFGSLLSAHCRNCGVELDEGDPFVPTNRKAVGQVDRLGLPDRYVCIHTSSEDGSKDWQTGLWNGLIDHIYAMHGLLVVEVGLRSLLGRTDDDSYLDLCGRTSIAETVEIIRRAALYIGIDSGPAHLANAVKTPGVILLGRHLKWDFYMPYTGFYADARNCRILRHAGPVSELPLGLCLNAVDEVLPALLDTTEDPQHA